MTPSSTMNEVEWNEEAMDAPPKKRRIPRWVFYGCGCGCLAAIVLTAVVGWLMVDTIREARDPEKQWPKLARILPFEERPANLELELGNPVPFLDRVMEMYTLRDRSAGHIATVLDFKEQDPAEFENMFDPDPSGTLFGLGKPVDPVVAEIEVQGREVRTLRFRTLGGQGSVEDLGPGIRVDVSRPGHQIVVEMRRVGSQEPFDDAAVVRFFEPFDVWKE